MSPKTKFIYDEFNDSKGNILSSLPSLFALGQNPTNQSLCLPSGIGGFSQRGSKILQIMAKNKGNNLENGEIILESYRCAVQLKILV